MQFTIAAVLSRIIKWISRPRSFGALPGNSGAVIVRNERALPDPQTQPTPSHTAFHSNVLIPVQDDIVRRCVWMQRICILTRTTSRLQRYVLDQGEPQLSWLLNYLFTTYRSCTCVMAWNFFQKLANIITIIAIIYMHISKFIVSQFSVATKTLSIK